ncbi:TPA: hypothetical protein QIF36_002397 [Enterobacter kobei]|nr:hypothetical protein [Enterobacter kobei]
MNSQIVVVNVSTIAASVPVTLQRTGAIISTGSTPLAPGSSQVITQYSDITALVDVKNTRTVAGLESDGAELTIELDGDVALTAGERYVVGISGALPAAFNGQWDAEYTGNSTFVADTTIAASVATINGMAELPPTADDEELLVNFSSFFAQGKRQAAYVLELGPSAGAISALTAYMADPALRFYTYRVPDAWDGNDDFIHLAKNNAANDSMVYFFIDSKYTMTQGSPYVSPYYGVKSVVVAAKGSVDDWFSPSVEQMWQVLSTAPSEVSKVAPFAFRYVIGADPLNDKNGAKNALLSQNVNFIGTGAEGGISNTIVFGGFTADGRDIMQWYAVDWVQINVAQALAKAVIDGSNTPENPLYYNQPGINTLQSVAQAKMNSAVTFGMSNGTPVVECVPFLEYIQNNQEDYAKGRYAGIYVNFVPNRGFTQLVFNMTVDFSGQTLTTA